MVSIGGLDAVAGAWSFRNLGRPQVWLALVTFLYADLLETTGCLYSMARQVGAAGGLGWGGGEARRGEVDVERDRS